MKVEYNGMKFEGFEIEGEKFTYPLSFCNANELEKENYREFTRRQVLLRKLEEKESKFSTLYKIKRSFKNFGLEFAASTLEAVVCFLNLGHVVRFDEIRDKKEISHYKN